MKANLSGGVWCVCVCVCACVCVRGLFVERASGSIWCFVRGYLCIVHFALRPQKRDGLLGPGTGGEGDERVKARRRIPPEKDRRVRGPPTEQWKC